MSHTPGPWQWNLSEHSKRVTLQGGVPRFDLTVIDFVRWGTQGAAPRFRQDVDRMNIMDRCEKYGAVVAGREHHADWFKSIAHPDALLIAAAPDLLALLVESQTSIGGDWRERRDAVIAKLTAKLV